MSVLPSSPTAVVAPPIFIGAWFAMPGIPVIARSTPDRRGISRSLNVSVRRFVAPTVALAAGVELTSLGWASAGVDRPIDRIRSEEHTSELQSLMRISYAVFCLKKKKKNH